MKRQMNQTILENGVYGLLWAVVLVVPLFGYHDGSGIRWCGVFHFWLGVLPFALLFALHNYLLVPLLLMRRRYGVYVLCVVALIGLIFTAVPMLVIRPEPPAFYGREVRAYPGGTGGCGGGADRAGIPAAGRYQTARAFPCPSGGAGCSTTGCLPCWSSDATSR